MRKILIVGAVAAVLGSTALVQASDNRASCTSMSANQWLSIQELAAKLAAQGYTVEKIELKRNCGEAALVDANGVRTEVRFDPANGAIMNRHREDSRHDRRHRDDRR